LNIQKYSLKFPFNYKPSQFQNANFPSKISPSSLTAAQAAVECFFGVDSGGVDNSTGNGSGLGDGGSRRFPDEKLMYLG